MRKIWFYPPVRQFLSDFKKTRDFLNQRQTPAVAPGANSQRWRWFNFLCARLCFDILSFGWFFSINNVFKTLFSTTRFHLKPILINSYSFINNQFSFAIINSLILFNHSPSFSYLNLLFIYKIPHSLDLDTPSHIRSCLRPRRERLIPYVGLIPILFTLFLWFNSFILIFSWSLLMHVFCY